MPVPARDGGTAGNGEDRIAQMGEDAAMTDGAAQDRDGENGEAAIDRTVVIGGKRVRYIDPLSDWGFKTLFGSEANKEFLIALLQALFPRKRITDISYLRNENQGLSGSDRKSGKFPQLTVEEHQLFLSGSVENACHIEVDSVFEIIFYKECLSDPSPAVHCNQFGLVRIVTVFQDGAFL